MYSQHEIALLRKTFWTSLGQYMRPLTDAAQQPVNWLNYKTGVRHLYFRMDAGSSYAAIAIELHHPDAVARLHCFEQFRQLKHLLEQETGEPWDWEPDAQEENGKAISRIGTLLTGVNILKKEDWPALISFLKPRMLALDAFWNMVKDRFE